MDRLDSKRAARRIWAAVPFRGPAGSKRRLASLLDAAERERLSLAMLLDVLDALLDAEAIERVLLLTPAGNSDLWPRHARLVVVDEPPQDGASGDNAELNRALHHAQTLADAAGADALLILPGDLPLLESGDLDAVLKAGAPASAVIAPDRAMEGTNALLLSPPNAIRASFGAGSYLRHRALGDGQGLHVVSVERNGLGLDLDTPDDISALLAHDHDGRAATFLREIGVRRRLDDCQAAQARSTTI